MEDAAFSDDFCRFLQTVVPTVDAAELLLLLQREPERWWTAQEAIAALLLTGASVTEAEATRYFGIFQSNGLIAVGPDKRVQYRPGFTALEGHVHTLAQAYSERPVTLIRVIYALRDSKIQSFADAFKLKRN